MAVKKSQKKNNASRLNRNTRDMVILTGNPIWRAFSKKPVSQTVQITIGLAGRKALYALTTNNGRFEDFNELVVTAYAAIILAEGGWGHEFLGDFNSALETILECRLRALTGACYSLCEKEAEAVNTLLELHEQQVQLADKAELASAIVEGYQRAQETR
ncbi:MAG: hypothetical protein HXX19_20265 [Rhodoferax sp.]|nr:hypothetical protein [Rhodoferax sp.]